VRRVHWKILIQIEQQIQVFSQVPLRFTLDYIGIPKKDCNDLAAQVTNYQ